MKLLESAKVISAYAIEFARFRRIEQAGWLTDLSADLSILGEFTMASLVAKCDAPLADAAKSPLSEGAGPSGSDVAGVVIGLSGILKLAREVRYSADLELLAQLIDRNLLYLENIRVILKDTMMPPAPDLDSVAKRLKDASGTEQFDRLYADLIGLNLDKDSLVQIAKLVYGAKPRGSSKAAALDTIRKLHDVGTLTRRSLESQGGRSAA